MVIRILCIVYTTLLTMCHPNMLNNLAFHILYSRIKQNSYDIQLLVNNLHIRIVLQLFESL